MYAVVETGGKQYQVKEGKYVDIELMDASPDTKVELDKVIAIIAGDHSKIGQPYIEGAFIHGKVLKHDRSKKVIIYKMRKKKGYRVKKGHRQDFTRLLIEDIEFPNKEEVLKHSKALEEQAEKELAEKEAKLNAAKEKKKAKAKTKTESKKKQPKAKKETTKEEKLVVEEETKIESQETIEETIIEATEQSEVVTEETTTEEETNQE